jgi:uncharacterized protein YbjT (DUF2867 family)
VILVAGATGRLGGVITRELLYRGEPVRILVRGGTPFDELVEAGAQPAVGDLTDARSLRFACEGADAVVTTASSASRGPEDTVDAVDRAGNQNLVDAAAAAGVRRFVFVSAAGASTTDANPFLQAKAETEEYVRKSGMSWTVLAPMPFMDVWFPAVVGRPALAHQPVTIVGEGHRHHSFVAVPDVAAYAVAALARPAAAGQTLVVGGPEAVTWRDVVAEFEGVLGRAVPIRSVAPGEPVPGLPPALAELLAHLDTYDSVVDMTQTARTYGVTPTSLCDFVVDFLRRQP